VQLWDLGTRQRVGEPLHHKGQVRALAASPGATRLLVGCWDRSAHLWDLDGRQSLKDFRHQDHVSVVAFSPDGRWLATGGFDKGIRIWNSMGKFEQRFALAHTAAVDAIAFSHAGRLLITGCDGAARLWDVVTGKQIGPPHFHDLFHVPNPDRWVAGQTRSVEFSPDDRRVLTAGADHSIRIWPVLIPLAGDVDGITSQIESQTIMELDSAGAPGDLDLPSWHARRSRAGGIH
jgi:WD40 repeat protein